MNREALITVLAKVMASDDHDGSIMGGIQVQVDAVVIFVAGWLGDQSAEVARDDDAAFARWLADRWVEEMGS